MLEEWKGYHHISINGRNKFITNSNEKISLFDGILEVSIEDRDEIDMTLTKSFKRLSRLFDNNIDGDNSSVVSPIDGLLKYETDSNGNRLFIIDPKKNN